MREPVTWTHTQSMFGHTYSATLNEQSWKVVENQEEDWLPKNKKMTKGYWFRSPKLSLTQLAKTLDFLTSMDHPYWLEVWATVSEVKENETPQPTLFDASLRLKNEDDAMMLAYSLTQIWMKWSKENEAEFKQKLKPQKPTKIKINKDGTITAKVTVTSLGD